MVKAEREERIGRDDLLHGRVGGCRRKSRPTDDLYSVSWAGCAGDEGTAAAEVGAVGEPATGGLLELVPHHMQQPASR